MKTIHGARLLKEAPVLLCFVPLVLFSRPSHAAVITVPGDYATIQGAISAAIDRDEIIVSPGTHFENISFGGKNIILRSTDPTSQTVVAATIIDGNHTGSVVTFSGSELTTCVLSGFTITSGYAPQGGGICGNGTLATIQNSIVSNNSAAGYYCYGGGLHDCDGQIQNNTIANNAATGEYNYGGGLARCDGVIENNAISNNSGDPGGGFYECNGGIKNNTISGNSGGGISWCNGTIENNIISGNSGSGGLLWCGGIIQNNIISDNTGGGLCACNATIQNNRIYGNSAVTGGGLESCHGTIRNNIISGNSASNAGGGISRCDGLILNNTICDNTAVGLYSRGIGGGLAGCNGIILNNTISGNRAHRRGGGLAHCGGFIVNCIIWGNTTISGNQLYNCSTPFFSCVQDWSGQGRGNIFLDPHFVDPAQGNYHLNPDSPCIDAGNSYYIVGEYIADIDGECRITGSSVDIGSDEHNSSLDSDGDILADTDEDALGSNASNPDTDEDGLIDGVEVLRGTNPTSQDTPPGLSVPAQCSSLQQGIFLAFTNEKITVSPGTYYENIYLRKNVILTGTNPDDNSVVRATIVDGGQLFPTVFFGGDENESCCVRGLTIRNGKAPYGGGINGNGTQATIEKNIISENEATSIGGGLYDCDGIIENNNISRNSVTSWGSCGGGIGYCDGAIHGNVISANMVDLYGGGLYRCNGNIEANTISYNKTASSGGGISDCSGTILNNLISSNVAELKGGGIYRCDGTIRYNIITSNSAEDGAGLFYCDAVIQNNTVSHNLASVYGGGLDACYGIIQGNIISGNTAYEGGGLAGCYALIQNNIISGNIASWFGGGLYRCNDTIQNNTIYGNSSVEFGGGLHECQGIIRNCIIWGNSARSKPQLDDFCSLPSYSCIQNWIRGGTGNITSDPQFVDPANEDFHIRLSSPCIDAGTYVSGLTEDFEGDPRPYDGTYEPRGDGSDFDIGADEYIAPRPEVEDWDQY